MDSSNDLETATLGGGCFWCLDAVYRDLRGVEKVVSGYSGGSVKNPAYREVCTGRTGHAEVVQVTFDPSVVLYRDLLGVFFAIHDPTTLNRQGADEGTQYRSVIYTHSPEQEKVAREMVTQLESEGLWGDPIVTEITPFETFYEAEAEHQDYFSRNTDQSYCRVVIQPKVAKFRKLYMDRLRADAAINPPGGR